MSYNHDSVFMALTRILLQEFISILYTTNTQFLTSGIYVFPLITL